ncbi:uncharacterized protein si:dkeyp-69c1.9 [Syngnathoides biaculeatus]|uniref:uncharacterized protein si:dkeyp-69c1.9 n=1 Tax=Syngnathoides biaculeatus TaxID=300417 RepID=UPI002ADDA4BA|nr:uncharacterized protein si:dkeyp-69c1.9 [Syngnathoides biaculeatus]
MSRDATTPLQRARVPNIVTGSKITTALLVLLLLNGGPLEFEAPGQLSSFSGFLLYPDTPVKMETTSREAFCFRKVSPRNSGKGPISIPGAQTSWRETRHSHPATSRQTGSGKSRHLEDDKEPHVCDSNQNPEMLSQYQKDFPPPSSWHRRTPALPQPDNIGINPAFRIEFGTVHRETYPNWPNPDKGRALSTNTKCPSRNTHWTLH